MKKILLKSTQTPSDPQPKIESTFLPVPIQVISQNSFPTSLEGKYRYFLRQHKAILHLLYKKWIIPYCKESEIIEPSFEDFSIFCFEYTD